MPEPTATASPVAAELPRKLNLLDSAALLVGAVIGSGIFMVPSLIARRIPEPGLVIAIWIFSGLLCLCGALALAELGAMLPQAGGLYVYIREAYGPFWGFLYGWTTLLVSFSGAIAALTAAFLLYFQYFVPMAAWVEKSFGIAVILLLGWVNARGVVWGARVQNLFTFLKVAGLAGLVILAVVLRPGATSNFLPLWPDGYQPGLAAAIGAAMVATLFAYEGWHFVSFAAGEIQNPQKTIPRGIILGVLIVIVVYVSANMAYIYVLGQPGVAASNRVASDTVQAMIGPVGGSLITLAVLCSTFGAINANVLAGPRIYFAMARDGVFFRSIAEVHPRYQSPAKAVWLLSVWSALLTLTGGYEHLITMAIFASWLLFLMAVASVIVLRRRHPEWARPYRLPGYPWTAVAFLGVGAAFVTRTLVDSPRSSLLGLGLVLTGAPIYFLWKRKPWRRAG